MNSLQKMENYYMSFDDDDDDDDINEEEENEIENEEDENEDDERKEIERRKGAVGQPTFGGYSSCGASGCYCPAYSGNGDTCQNCGHSYHMHY